MKPSLKDVPPFLGHSLSIYSISELGILTFLQMKLTNKTTSLFYLGLTQALP